MGAVAEPAAPGDRLDLGGDFGERRGHPRLGVPQRQLAHPRRVEDQRPGRQQDQLAMGGGVPAVRVSLADVLGGHPLGAGQRIDQGGLADARRAQQHRGPAGRQEVAELRQPLAGAHRHRQHRRPGGDGEDLGGQALDVVAGVGLGQQEHRPRPALQRGGQVAFQPARVEIGVQRGRQQGHVDVGGHHLHRLGGAGGHAGEGRGAGQDGGDHRGVALQLHRHPVAGDRIAAVQGLMGETA